MPYYWFGTDLAQYVPQMIHGTDVVTATSVPVNASQFDVMIELVSAKAEAAAAKGGYAVPIATGATIAYRQMKDVVKHGALAALYDRMPDGRTKSEEYRDAFEDFLTQLEEGDLSLPGAEHDTGEGARGLPRGGSSIAHMPWSLPEGMSVGSMFF
jgi:hypothetical protein